MDTGLYNKSVQYRGDHGALMGNWVEERQMLAEMGFARHVSLDQQNFIDPNTKTRTLGIPTGATTSYASTTSSHYPPHSAEAFPPKIFNQLGSHWHNTKVEVKAGTKNVSHIKLGELDETEKNWCSTSSASFVSQPKLDVDYFPNFKIPEKKTGKNGSIPVELYH